MFNQINLQEGFFTKLAIKQRVSKTEKEHLTDRLDNLVSDFEVFIKDKFSRVQFTEKIVLKVQGGYGKGNAVKKVKGKDEKKYNDGDILIVLPKEFYGHITADQLVHLLYSWLKDYAFRHGLKEPPKPDDRCVKLFYSEITFDFLITIRNPYKEEWVFSPVANKDPNVEERYSFRAECPEVDLRVFNEKADISKIIQLSEKLANARGDDLDFTGPIEDSDNPGVIRVSSMFLKRSYSDEYSDNPQVKKALKSHLINCLAIKLWNYGDYSIVLTEKIFDWLILNLSGSEDINLYIDEINPEENIAAHLNGVINELRRKRILKWAIKAKEDFLNLIKEDKPLNFINSASGYFDEFILSEAKNSLGVKFDKDSSNGSMKYVSGGSPVIAAAATAGISSTAKAFYGGAGSKSFSNTKLFKQQHSRLSLMHQVSFMKAWFPQFDSVFLGSSVVEWRGSLVSPITGKTYCVRIKYGSHLRVPKVFIEGVSSKDPHIYLNDLSLCLHFPESKNWNPSMLIGKTVVIWTINWIVQNEIYKQTGKFNGQEVKHG